MSESNEPENVEDVVEEITPTSYKWEMVHGGKPWSQSLPIGMSRDEVITAVWKGFPALRNGTVTDDLRGDVMYYVFKEAPKRKGHSISLADLNTLNDWTQIEKTLLPTRQIKSVRSSFKTHEMESSSGTMADMLQAISTALKNIELNATTAVMSEDALVQLATLFRLLDVAEHQTGNLATISLCVVLAESLMMGIRSRHLQCDPVTLQQAVRILRPTMIATNATDTVFPNPTELVDAMDTEK